MCFSGIGTVHAAWDSTIRQPNAKVGGRDRRDIKHRCKAHPPGFPQATIFLEKLLDGKLSSLALLAQRQRRARFTHDFDRTAKARFATTRQINQKTTCRITSCRIICFSCTLHRGSLSKSNSKPGATSGSGLTSLLLWEARHGTENEEVVMVRVRIRDNVPGRSRSRARFVSRLLEASQAFPDGHL